MHSAVNRLLAQKGASFEQANIYRVSQAAAPLAAWVTANLQYADVLQKVAPLEQELSGLTANFTESQVRQPRTHTITTTVQWFTCSSVSAAHLSVGHLPPACCKQCNCAIIAGVAWCNLHELSICSQPWHKFDRKRVDLYLALAMPQANSL